MLPVRVAPPTRPPTAHQRPPTRGGKVTCVMCHTKRVLLGFLHVACDLWPFHAGFLHRQPPTPRHHSLTRGPLGVQSRSELDRIVFESIGFFCPGFTDGFERREPIQSLETLGEVVGVEECLDVLAKLVVAVVVVAPNSRLFESTVHPLDLPVRPRM